MNVTFYTWADMIQEQQARITFFQDREWKSSLAAAAVEIIDIMQARIKMYEILKGVKT